MLTSTTMAPNLATRYLESMKHHPYGYAFYEPEAASEVRPGTCGYLNEFCQWQPIADLTDVNDLQKKGLTEPADLIAAKDSSHEWGPKLSHSVRSAKLNVNLGASGAAAGIPAEASVSYEFWSLLDHGAILYCPSKVFQQGYHYRHEFVQWAKANAKQLAKIRPEVKDDGFYVVTSTYTTDDIWINAWSEQGKKVAMGFKVSAVGAGEVAPSGEFFKAEGASGWTHATPEVCTGGNSSLTLKLTRN